MKAIWIAVLCGFGVSAGADTAPDSMSPCSSGLVPLSHVVPKVAPRLHNEFEGKVEVSFTIDRAGKVQSPSIVSEEWHPVGRSRGEPIGYHEAILSAVAQWRYPGRAKACRLVIPIKITFDLE